MGYMAIVSDDLNNAIKAAKSGNFTTAYNLLESAVQMFELGMEESAYPQQDLAIIRQVSTTIYAMRKRALG